MEVSFFGEEILKNVRVEDNKPILFIFYFLFFIPFCFSFSDLRLEVSMMSHITVTNYHTLVTYHRKI